MTKADSGEIAVLLEPRIKDIGDLEVRRVLPATQRRHVGPFVFFDHFGPVEFPPGSGLNVRPHPHIGLATITYLFTGTIVHRDSLGFTQPITANAVNWMTAGKGIVHSERSSKESIASGSRLHGVQAWVALPLEDEETEPRFEHYGVHEIPLVQADGATVRIIAGQAFDAKSPVRTCSETLYADIEMEAGATINTPRDIDECAVYVVSGDVRADGRQIPALTMAVLAANTAVALTARSAARVILLGGATLEGKRTVWWNFVSSSKERIEKAKRDWRANRFDPVPGERDYIPLPEN